MNLNKCRLNNNLSLYDIFDIDKTSTKEEIRKKYKLLALKYHPDKNKDDNSTQHFQELNKAYNILIDEEKRKLYDETGELFEDFDLNNFKNAYEYFRNIFPKITIENIKSYESTYVNSLEEIQDIAHYYISKNGNIEDILNYIPFSTNKDIKRFVNIIEKLIKEKKLQKTVNFNISKNKIKKQKESKKTKKTKKDNDKDFNNLAELIRNKNKDNKNINVLDSIKNNYVEKSCETKNDIKTTKNKINNNIDQKKIKKNKSVKNNLNKNDNEFLLKKKKINKQTIK